MQFDIKYLYDQAMTLSDQRTGKCYQMQISEHEVAGIIDWGNSAQYSLLIMKLHKAMTIKWYQVLMSVYAVP